MAICGVLSGLDADHEGYFLVLRELLPSPRGTFVGNRIEKGKYRTNKHKPGGYGCVPKQL
jgi:hypothetical protein